MSRELAGRGGKGGSWALLLFHGQNVCPDPSIAPFVRTNGDESGVFVFSTFQKERSPYSSCVPTAVHTSTPPPSRLSCLADKTHGRL